MNSFLFGSVVPSMNFHQGNSLSLYLSVLCAEGLSMLIHGWVRDTLIQGIQVARDSPMIFHLFFVYDSRALFKAIMEDCSSLLLCLKEYEAVSGQLVNCDKSTILFSLGTPRPSQEGIKAALNIKGAIVMNSMWGYPPFL